jgi:hypothetical protein
MSYSNIGRIVSTLRSRLVGMDYYWNEDDHEYKKCNEERYY